MAYTSAAPEISTHQLAQALESGEPVQVVDVRAPAQVAAGHIDIVPDGRFHNIVGSQLVKVTRVAGTAIDPSLPVTVVCGHGNDSKLLAHHLNRLGFRANSLAGGMSAWMMLALPRELATPPSLDRLIQFDRIGKGALGYLLVSGGEALIVDPPRNPRAYLEAAAEAGAGVVGVADTHVHADYISGASTIATTLGVPYYLHPADAVYPYDGTPGRLQFEPLADGDTIPFGRSSVHVVHTPGHTEGSLTYVIDDAVALTGDFIFVGSVGRPDLAGKVREWTAQLWESLERAKREWPPDRMIYPAHYGSDAERRADRAVGECFGQILEANEAMQFSDPDAFARWVESKTVSFPEAYRRIKAVNVGLLPVDGRQAEELEVGKNECALGGR
ncbi:MAG: MBL fold metallo-hydrolase [Gemmatimonadota bacterium]|nr:MBL fold metallo-hydrolase [Gemmatimonadota bacterium]MDH3367705.1 MBL fold metallo-hydrolase [Gemmatimonadota bacterium]MDH3479769.1 MBL fold metallo-hydrolase [Gemmatimonadota bacterium]MDH3570140.1 MBL fold metallo-hydrolase [Gemmatimonadota bacterium]MDH5549794.1 MBL fold metallo-hydrolase [Gemmatimonadota bacterium]